MADKILTKSFANKIGKVIQWIMIILGFFGMFGAIIGASIAWGEWKSESKERMFKDSNERVKTEQLVAEPYSRYRMMIKTDSLLEQQRFLTIAFDTINKRHESDAEDKYSRVKSRDERDSIYRVTLKNQRHIDSIQEAIQKEQTIQTTINLSILTELKDIKNLMDTIN